MRTTLIVLTALAFWAVPASAQFNPETIVAQQLVADQGLFFALAQNDIQTMAAMRDQGADPNATLSKAGLKPQAVFDEGLPIFKQPFNTTGWPILTWAIYLNNERAVNLLLRAGARVNAPDEYGATALHWAAWAGRHSLAKLLLNNGAACAASDFKGRTPKDWAVMVSQTDMIRLIESRSCRQGIGDEDRDGVSDGADQCPGTPFGAPVDERGCWVVAYAAFFDFDRSVIKTEFLPHIQQAARILVNYPDLQVTLVGHSDYKGSDEYNYGLGLRRAQAVKRELVRNGVTASRLGEDSGGEREPIADNLTASGRARNRRVEIHVLQTPGN
jgi:outer membrane protein OmpA-like peptidoglycan-associated protein